MRDSGRGPLERRPESQAIAIDSADGGRGLVGRARISSAVSSVGPSQSMRAEPFSAGTMM